MIMHRLLKRKNLFALLFAVLLAFPMFSILARTIYVSANKNAKDSYSGIQGYEIEYKYETNEVNNFNDLISGNIYTLSINDWANVLVSGATYNMGTMYEIELLQFNYSYLDMGAIQDGNYIELSFNRTNNTIYMAQFELGAYKTSINIPTSNIGTNLKYNFVYRSNFNENYISYVSACTEIPIKNITIDNTGTLDNAFEYSVNQFIDDNNFGKLDFFQWFNNMFLDSNNDVNNMYVHFVNWYLNYALLISLAYILFLVLMWFINFARKLLEKGMDFGEGSY